MPGKILVVDDEEIIRESLTFILRKEGYVVDEAENGKIAHQKILENFYDIVITDIEMPEMKGIELLEKISALTIQTAVMIITAYGSLDTAIRALRNGASDYILKPVEFDELVIKIKRILDTKRILLENQILRRETQRNYDFSRMIGKSPMMQKIFDMIKTVADSNSTVMITGNSGTGKELVARAIHAHGRRSTMPFVALNCGAISENLIESELFGHKKGSFTGAVSDKEGFLKAADGGTLFLDEISEMPINLQTKLLRVIQEKECTPVGTTYTIPIDVRFLASTNRNLKAEVEKGSFREDLYYRLNVIELNVPSLKNRREDIPLLVDFFINRYREEMNKPIKGVDAAALRAMMNHDWRGEVRELENVIERAVLFAQDEMVVMNDLPEYIRSSKEFTIPDELGSLDEYLKLMEKEFVMKALESNNFDKEKTADSLKLGLSTLYRKIKDLGIEA